MTEKNIDPEPADETPDDVVTESDTGWDYVCGTPRCGFQSTRWPTRELATLRGAEHRAEHNSAGKFDDEGNPIPATPMREVYEFNVEHGLQNPIAETEEVK